MEREWPVMGAVRRWFFVVLADSITTHLEFVRKAG